MFVRVTFKGFDLKFCKNLFNLNGVSRFKVSKYIRKRFSNFLFERGLGGTSMLKDFFLLIL